MKVLRYRKYCLIVLMMGVYTCNKSDDINASNCDYTTIISSELYANAPSDHLLIDGLEISGDCLKISFTSSGCSGDTWELKLIDSEAILESNPAQRNLRLSFKNDELCLAVISKELTFDISNLQVNENKILLNLTNSDDQILYEY